MPLYDDPTKPRVRSLGGGGGASPAPGAQGATPSPTTAPAPAGGAPAAQPRQVGTGFVGFDRYFNANRQGAQQMADRVGGAVQTSGQAAQGAIQGAQNTFNAATEKNTLTYDPNRAQSFEENKELAGTEYKGPKTWGEAGVDTGRVAEQVNAAQAKAANLGTMGGRSALLRESYRSGPTTSGGGMLDAALAGQAGGSRFAELEALYGGLGKQLETAQGAAPAAFEAAKSATDTAADKYEADLGQWQVNDVRRNPMPTEQAPVAVGNQKPGKKRNFFDRLGHTIFGGG